MMFVVSCPGMKDAEGSPVGIEWRPVRVRLGDLRPWERNPRRMSRRAARRLLESWREFGQVQTIAIGPDGEVYDGHQRLSVLRAVYGPDHQVLALQSSRPLTEQERERLTLLLHAGAIGEWDWDALLGWDIDVLAGVFDTDYRDVLRSDLRNLNALLTQIALEDKTSREKMFQPSEEYVSRWEVVVECDSEENARTLYNEMTGRGYRCRVLNL